MQNCIQLLLAFSENGANALVVELDGRVVGIGESGVRCFKV